MLSIGRLSMQTWPFYCYFIFFYTNFVGNYFVIKWKQINAVRVFLVYKLEKKLKTFTFGGFLIATFPSRFFFFRVCCLHTLFTNVMYFMSLHFKLPRMYLLNRASFSLYLFVFKFWFLPMERSANQNYPWDLQNNFGYCLWNWLSKLVVTYALTLYLIKSLLFKSLTLITCSMLFYLIYQMWAPNFFLSIAHQGCRLIFTWYGGIVQNSKLVLII